MTVTTLRMKRGDQRSFTVTVLDSAGAAVDISAATLRFTARRGYGTAAVIETTNGAGIEFGTGTGEAVLTIEPADTVTLPDAITDLLWDLEVTDASGNPQTPLEGVLRISPDLSEVEAS